MAAAAVLFSTGGAAIKSTSLSGIQVAGLRSLVAVVAIVLLLPEARRGWRLRHVPGAIAYSGTLIAFVLANKLTTSANAVFLQHAAPLFVLLLAPLLLHERVRPSDLAFMAAVAFGMALFFVSAERAHATAPDPARGNLFGALSAVTWALTLIGLRWIGRTGASAMPPVVLGNAMIALTIVPPSWPSRLSPTDAAVLLWLGVFQIGLAYVCLTRGIRRLPALEATTILLLEPALNPVWAWLVHGERPSALSLAGGAIIIAATIARVRSKATEPASAV
ncbi:MAG TPA: DMT family transporter [Bryobacteraceae bacterium]|nr:DMT family transporter [Bryobacteraceae bacterium]